MAGQKSLTRPLVTPVVIHYIEAMEPIKLTQTASWNPALTNPYRTRWATAAGRYFQISADSLQAPWMIEEVDAAGEWLAAGFTAVAFTLAEARTTIAAATA